MTIPSFQLFNRDGQASTGELERLAARVEQRDRAAVGAPYEGGSSLELLESAAGPVTSILPPETLWAQLTAYDQATGLYTWVWAVEQLDGTFAVNKARGGGPPANYPAVDPNGLLYPLGVFVRLQPSQGGPYYRIIAPGTSTMGGGSPRLLITGIFSEEPISSDPGAPIVVVYTAVLLQWDPQNLVLVQTKNNVLAFEPNGGFLVLGQAYAADFVALVSQKPPDPDLPLYVTDDEMIFGPSGENSSQGIVPDPGPFVGQTILTGQRTLNAINPGLNTVSLSTLSGTTGGNTWSFRAGDNILVGDPPDQALAQIINIDPNANSFTANFSGGFPSGTLINLQEIKVLRFLREDAKWASPSEASSGGGGSSPITVQGSNPGAGDQAVIISPCTLLKVDLGSGLGVIDQGNGQSFWGIVFAASNHAGGISLADQYMGSGIKAADSLLAGAAPAALGSPLAKGSVVASDLFGYWDGSNFFAGISTNIFAVNPNDGHLYVFTVKAGIIVQETDDGPAPGGGGPGGLTATFTVVTGVSCDPVNGLKVTTSQFKFVNGLLTQVT